ncbi:hypothetical protein VTI74DRAFT_2618 [Chaetomium olivicolor]
MPSPFPTWQQPPQHSTLPESFLTLKYTTPENSCDVTAGKGQGREYQYDYYPNHSQERVEATRSGNTLNIAVTAAGKMGRFKATITLRPGASTSKPAPVVISIGGMQSQPYLNAGIAIAQFDYTSVAPDNNAKTGAFWSVYNGRDIAVLTAWAWGFHRTLDAINMTVPEIDPTRVSVTGCSRLGKAALAAGLFDTRIALTMPMSSGVQGMGPYRYYSMSGQGENLENSKEPAGTGDQFVNSKGTAVVIYPAAKVVYDWLGVGDKIAISVRSGGHCDMSGFTSILPFVRKILFGTPTTKDFNSLGSYGSPVTTAFPWATAVPKAT